MSARIVSGIYLIRNTVNGKIYVGSAERLEKRFSRHKTYLRAGIHHSSLLQRAWNKYGEAAFAFSCLEVVDCNEQLVDHEQAWIDRLRAADRARGYNMLPTAGSNLGYLYSAESKARMSLAQKAWKRGPQSAEHRAAISAGNMGKKVSPETGVKISLAKKGKGISVITIEAARLANTGRKHTPEIRAKWSAKAKGRKDSPEVRERKCLAAQRRSPLTEADVRAIRASDEPRAVLAKRHGVSYYTIWDIHKHRSWRIG